MKKWKKRIRWVLGILAFSIFFFYWAQNEGVHKDDSGYRCECILGWITKSDRIDKEDSSRFQELQPGDIILSFSTHTLGWRHGHAGLVLDKDSVLECRMVGKPSAIVDIDECHSYSHYVVLRVRNVSREQQESVVTYAKEKLCGVPYRLTAGIFDRSKVEGMQCTYLVWYAWRHAGYDLDFNGGRLVTVRDLFCSEDLEVIQMFGEY